MKRKTKKRIKMAVVWSLLAVMFLSLLTGLIPRQPEGVTITDPKLLEAYLKGQDAETGLEILPNIEGDYKVTEVLDGASLSIMWGDEKRTAKLIGVDVPEGMEKQAAALLENEIGEDKMVSLEFDKITEDEDGNLLVYAYHPNDIYTTLNSRLLMDGCAKLIEEKENKKYIEDLRSVEKMARENKIGCWEEPEDDGK